MPKGRGPRDCPEWLLASIRENLLNGATVTIITE